MTWTAVEIEGADRKGPWLVTCDHASNAVPPWVHGGDLGVSKADMGRHIAYDIGAAGVSRHLAQKLDAPVVLSRFSRLVIDPNRGEDDPTLVMQLYDGTVIEGNRFANPTDRARRLAQLYRPYHCAIDAQMEGRMGTYISVHSFTPQLSRRAPRPWHIAVLYAADDRFATPLLARLRQEKDLCVGENQPYTGSLKGDAIEQHALAKGWPNALLEIRNDLIETEAQQRAWAVRLASILEDVRTSLEIG